MGNKLTEKGTTTSQPAAFFANDGDDVVQLTWSGFVTLLSALYVTSASLDADSTMAANSDAKVATQKAVKAFVAAQIAALVNSSPSTLDTLNELAAALGNDANFATTVATSLAGKVPVTRAVNGHALNADVTVTKGDVGLSAVTNDAQLKAADLDTDNTLAANSDTKIASQKAVKAFVAAAVAAGGGGGGLSCDSMAFVMTGGSDATGVIGDSSKPFLTLQAAYTAGARGFFIYGSVGDCAIQPGDTLYFAGLGAEVSQVGSLTWTSSSTSIIYIYGNGQRAVTINGIYGNGDGAGSSVASLECHGITLNSGPLLTAIAGADGGPGNDASEGLVPGDGSAGGAGGNAGNITLSECYLSGNLYTSPGNGGAGGAGGNSADATAPGGTGGSGGASGSSAVINIMKSAIVGYAGAPAGSGGGGGAAGSGSVAGAAGDTQPSGDPGDINARFSTINVAAIYGETTNYQLSIVADTAY